MKTHPNNDAPLAGEAAHKFLLQLHALIDAGLSSDVVWNYCVENVKSAKSDAAKILNRYQSRTDGDALIES